MRLLGEGDTTDDIGDDNGADRLREMGMEAMLPNGTKGADRDSTNLMELAAAAFAM